MSSAKDKLSKFWTDATPEKKRVMVIVFIAVSIALIGVIGYQNRTKHNTPQLAKDEKKRELSLDTKMLEKSAYAEQAKELRTRDEKLKELQSEIEQIKKAKTASEASQRKEFPPANLPPLPGSQGYPQERSAPQSGNNPGGVETMQREGEPGSYVPPYTVPPAPPTTGVRNMPNSNEPTMMGGIEIISAPQQPPIQGQDSKKKVEEKIYLPPSFMEATLLSGLDAPTTGDAKNNPVPVLIRVKEIAVLPNRVRANLKGCFIMADGVGNLADERAHIKLISLSCLAKDGTAVIDQKIKGFLVDADGKVGLSGNVVAKLGSAIARSMIAGFFGGLGDGVKAASTTTQITGAGTVQSFDSGQLLQTAVGSGIAAAAGDLQKFYLKLAEQTMPVIEIGASRQVTVVISEGIDLSIKEHCNRKNTLGDGSCDQSDK